MSLVIQTNVAALQATKNLRNAQTSLATSFNRLSSGYRINSAADDAAGLAISENMKMQIRSYMVAERNANDAVSMSQTAEGALGEMSGILTRMRELAMQGANGSLGQTDRGFLQTEFTALYAEISRITTSTKFNGVTLIGTAANPIAFQVGIFNTPNDQITVTFGNIDFSSIGNASVSGGTASLAQGALDIIDSTLSVVSTARANFGAVMNRLDVTVANLQTVRLNVSAANSRIRDVDVATTTSELSRDQVMAQAGTAILAQANQIPTQALQLLRG